MNAERGREHSVVTVVSERETPRGWRYEVTLRRDGSERKHRVDLAWVDHDHWSGGGKPPSVVVERLLTLLLELQPGVELPTHFDAANCRRLEPRLDELLGSRL